MENTKRVVWIDWLRVIACFMVLTVHSAEPFYLGGNGSLIATEQDALWVAFFDSIARSSVPLFVIASAFLQFPLHYPAPVFFRKRAVRILIPFALWSLFYAFYWGEPATNLENLLLNFNYSAGHLWFVYMLLGLYLLMPLLSPWAEKVSRKELSAYIGLWLLTTLVPLVRDWVSDAPLAITSGPSGVPRQALYPLWGEASWNAYGTFYYISGFIGYLFIGLWLRKFGGSLTRKQTFRVAVPCFLAGFSICFFGFIRRVSVTSGGEYPVGNLVNDAVWWETTWCNDTTGVALMTIGAVLLMMNIRSEGRFFRNVVSPVAKASYGIYLGHMVILAFFSSLFRGLTDSTPLVIVATAVVSFVCTAAIAVAVRRIPVVGKWIAG